MPEGKVQLRRIRCKGDDIIKRGMVEIECEAVGWINLPYSSVQCRILAACFVQVSCVAYSSTVTTEAIFSFETCVHFHPSMRSYISEDSTLHNTEVVKIYSKFFPSFVEKLEGLGRVENSEEYTPFRNKMKLIICTNLLSLDLKLSWQCQVVQNYPFIRLIAEKILSNLLP
jgi:hypothetical protein